MASADYRCRECGYVIEIDTSSGPTASPFHSEPAWLCQSDEPDKCPGTFDRVWAPPHIGPGSSGEPPR